MKRVGDVAFSADGCCPAMKPKEVSDRLQLDGVAKNHVWKVEPSCATSGDGIFEGLVRDIFIHVHA